MAAPLLLSAKQVGTILGITGQTVIRLEERGFLADVTGRTGPHHHYYAQGEVRTLQKVYATKLLDATLRGRLDSNATGTPNNYAGRVVGNTAAWLTAYLTARGGTARVSELLRDAHAAGHSQDACYSARNHVGIFSVGLGTEPGMGSMRGWSLPGGTRESGHDGDVPPDDVQVERSVPTPDQSRFLRPSDVTKMLNLSDATLWRLCKTPGFPKKYRLSDKAVGFRADEIQAWLEARRDTTVTGQRGRPRKLPWTDTIPPVDIPPPAVTPSIGQQRHDNLTTQLADLHAKLDRLLSIWE
jgi:predicted DNA-binding transcriptional regulator AlpA